MRSSAKNCCCLRFLSRPSCDCFLALLIGVIGTFFGSAGLAGVPEISLPNIVILLSDDQRWSDYSFQGHQEIQTPHLDRLARESLLFTRGYVPTSLCRPSLASILTGRYPHQHGITGNDPQGESKTPASRQAVVDHFLQNPCLPRLLRGAGYTCFQTGKWWEGNYANGGFNEGMTHGDVTRGGRHGDQGLQIGREGLQPIEDFLDRAAQSQQPFFLWYAPLLPHRPHNPPEEFLARFRNPQRSEPLAKYYAMVAWWDQTCGQLLGSIERRGLAPHTIVVYLSDNGWTETGDMNSNSAVGGPRGKRSVYDGGTRTPIMIRWPEKVPPRRDTEHLASSIDLLPTLLAAVVISPPPELPGINLLDPEAISARHSIYGEIFTHDIPSLQQPSQGLLYRWVISDQWKLILPTGRDPGKYGPRQPALFQILDDPDEQRDLLQEQPVRAAELRGLLDRWWDGQ